MAATETKTETKWCPGCCYYLPIERFHKNCSMKDGLQCHCQKCRGQRAKEYRQTNHGRGVSRENIRRYYNTLGSRLRRIFHHLEGRCNSPNDISYKNYGGRGIQNKFKSLDAFREYVINELGITSIDQIQGLQIDRINNDGHYEPGNIRFVTPKVNSNNRRDSKITGTL